MRTLRITLWLLEALIMIVAALTVAAAARASDAAPILLIGGIVLAILGVTAFALGRRRTRADWSWYEHGRGRRRALKIARRSALGLFLVFILAMAALLIFGSGFGSPLAPALVSLGALAALACVVGAAIELFAPASFDRERAARAAPKSRMVPVEGRDDTRDLAWVERQIDARAWQQAGAPTPDAVESALERWGKSNGKGTS